METKFRHFSESIERWSALFLAAAVTLLLFAAINAGFSVPGTDPVKLAIAQPAAPATDHQI